MNLKLAWRNIWRNKRRTLITVTSIFMAVLLAMMMRSVQLGVYDKMINNMISLYTCDIQVHSKGYQDNTDIAHSFIENDSLKQLLSSSSAILHQAPRLESFAMAAIRGRTRGVMVTGIDPAAENGATNLATRVTAGQYLDAGDSGILLSKGAAEYLGLQANDSLRLLARSYSGQNTAMLFRIKGIISFPVPQFNDGMVYMSLKQARRFYQAGNRLTSIAIITRQNTDAEHIAARLQKEAGKSRYEVLAWKELLPEMMQFIATDNMFGIIVIVILYMVISFGIFGTIVMMLAERQHEFGILVAIGMKKTRLSAVVLFEILMLATIGVITGAVAGLPVMEYFKGHPLKISGAAADAYTKFGMEPVIAFSDRASILYSQSIAVYAICLILAIYPFIRLRKLQTIKALKS